MDYRCRLDLLGNSFSSSGSSDPGGINETHTGG